MIRIYTHLDTWLCPKHNTPIQNRRSCDKCVVEQRAALHAAGICATETPLLTATGRAAPEVCDVKYHVNFPSDRRAAFKLLFPLCRTFLTFLDTTDSKVIRSRRRSIERHADTRGIALHDEFLRSALHELWMDLVTVHDGVAYKDVEKATFISYFCSLLRNGQRLVDVKPDTRYTVNFPSYAIPSYYDLHSTVRAVFGLLDTAHNTVVNNTRLRCQQYVATANCTPLETRLEVQHCAEDVWFYLRPSNTLNCIALRDKFVEHFRKLFADGQRLIVDTVDE